MGIRLWRFMCRVVPGVRSRQGTAWGSYGWIFTAYSAGHLYACIFKGVKLAKSLATKACDMFLLNNPDALSSWSDSAAPPGMEVVAHRNRGLTAVWGVAAARHRAAPATPADVDPGPRTTSGQPGAAHSLLVWAPQQPPRAAGGQMIHLASHHISTIQNGIK
jgi:hypothetical protein